MVMAIAYDDAKAHQLKSEGNGQDLTGVAVITPLFGNTTDRNRPDVPQAFLSEGDPGRMSRAHFHALDQFQVIVRGSVKVGRHEMLTHGVLVARAYTPYGPLVSHAQTGMTHLTLRGYHDPRGAQRIPDKQDLLQSIKNRQPWQVFTSQAPFPVLEELPATTPTLLEPVAGMRTDDGLGVYTVTMKPDTRVMAPDHRVGNGQYVVIMKGSLLHEGREYRSIALLFIKPDEKPYEIAAGPGGLQALVLNFPRPQAEAPAAASAAAARGDVWQCSMCAFIYQQNRGLPDEAIAPGTEWRKLPDTWSCPNCSSAKTFFKPL